MAGMDPCALLEASVVWGDAELFRSKAPLEFDVVAAAGEMVELLRLDALPSDDLENVLRRFLKTDGMLDGGSSLFKRLGYLRMRCRRI